MNNRIRSAVKLDFFTAKSSMTFLVITFVISILIGAATKQPIISLFLVMVFATFLCGYVFSIEEKNHSDKLYGILPMLKSEMIAGRYIYAIIIGVTEAVIAGIAASVISMALKTPIDAVSYLTALSLSFLYFCFAISVAFPIYIKYSFSRAYVFTMLPMYLIVLIGVFLARRTAFFGSLSQISHFLANVPVLIPVSGLVIGLALLTVSAFIANIIYSQKEI